MDKAINEKYKQQVCLLHHGVIDQRGFLDWLYNNVGTFFVQSHFTKKEEEIWGKRMDWLQYREQEKYEASHRGILKYEIVFDIDFPNWYQEKDKQYFLNMALKRLQEKWNIQPVIISTGGGYHLHWFAIDDLCRQELRLSEENFRNYKQRYAIERIGDIGTDAMKWNYNTSISVECSKHWKRKQRSILLLQNVSEEKVEN